MSNASNSLPKVASSWHEPALPAFTALCDEALRRCATQHGLPITPSDEMRLRAWQLCWLVLDAASAPANNLPDIAGSQGWPPELVEQLRAAPELPKLNTQAWQALRRARDQQLFATLSLQEPAAAQSIANDALAALLSDGFARLGLEQLRAWSRPSVTAMITRWLSAALLAVDSLALSNDNTDATALELVVFVQASLRREHGPAVTTDDAAHSASEPSAEEKRQLEAAAALAPEPAASPAVAAAPTTPEPARAVEQPLSASTARDAAARTVHEPARIVEQPASTSTARDAAGPSLSPDDEARVQMSARPRRSQRRTIVQVASGVAVAALVLVFILRSGNDAQQSDAPQPMNIVKPRALTPAPTPEPPVVAHVPAAPAMEPMRPLKPSTKGTATQRPRYRNLAAAKRAHAAKKIDDAAYAAAVAELEALRTAKIAKEQAELRSGKLSQHDYQRRVDAIDKSLGFDQR